MHKPHEPTGAKGRFFLGLFFPPYVLYRVVSEGWDAVEEVGRRGGIDKKKGALYTCVWAGLCMLGWATPWARPLAYLVMPCLALYLRPQDTRVILNGIVRLRVKCALRATPTARVAVVRPYPWARRWGVYNREGGRAGWYRHEDKARAVVEATNAVASRREGPAEAGSWEKDVAELVDIIENDKGRMEDDPDFLEKYRSVLEPMVRQIVAGAG